MPMSGRYLVLLSAENFSLIFATAGLAWGGFNHCGTNRTTHNAPRSSGLAGASVGLGNVLTN
jgi:hypothetical protein